MEMVGQELKHEIPTLPLYLLNIASLLKSPRLLFRAFNPFQTP